MIKIEYSEAEIAANITRTIEAIKKADPKRFEMANFLNIDRDVYPSAKATKCNTTACIGGWIALANLADSNPNFADYIGASGMAQMIGLDDYNDYEHSIAVEELFYLTIESGERTHRMATLLGTESPHQFIRKFDQLPPEVRQQAAINVLTILRDTRKVDWVTALEQALHPKAE